MKRFLLTILALIVMCGTVLAETRQTVTKNPAGFISHVSGIVTESGVTVFDFTTGASIYVQTLNLGSAVNILQKTDTIAGASIENAGVSSAKLTQFLTNTGVSTPYTIASAVSVYNLTAAQTLTAEMLGGAFIGNYNASALVPITVPHAWKGASCNISLDQPMQSGSTITVYFTTGDEIISGESRFNPGTAAGTSYYLMSSTVSGFANMSLVGKADRVWRVYLSGVSDVTTN